MVQNQTKLATLLILAAAAGPALRAQPESFNDRNGIRHVLLISIDSMHALDFLNCSQGLATVNFGQPYCPEIAQLARHGVNYLGATTSKPSDSFPGLMHRRDLRGPIAPMYNPAPSDPRTPDIIVAPRVGVIYTGSKRKLAEHGGFAHDDTNVMMLLSNPDFRPAVVTAPVETMQVAPTILQALGLNPDSLQSARLEGTQVLPELPLK